MPTDPEQRAPCIVKHWTDAHSGPGWYYYFEEYPDEGSCGPFDTRDEAVSHLLLGDGFVSGGDDAD